MDSIRLKPIFRRFGLASGSFHQNMKHEKVKSIVINKNKYLLSIITFFRLTATPTLFFLYTFRTIIVNYRQ